MIATNSSGSNGFARYALHPILYPLILSSVIPFAVRKINGICPSAGFFFKQFTNSYPLVSDIRISIMSKSIFSCLNLSNASFPELQKKAFPYGNLSTKPYNQFPFIFASPGPIYEPGNKNDFWRLKIVG